MTNNPDDPNFKYYAHTRGSASRDIFYLGAYKGYLNSSKLYSLSNKTPSVKYTISKFRENAHNKGSGYEQRGFYQLTYNQAMYILKYKNLNSQVALGRGYVDENSNITTTGGTNIKGMDFGETTGKLQMKLFGLEDFWGNIHEWIDGLYCDSSRHILTATDNFNDTGSGYTDQGEGATRNVGGNMSKPQGSSETGFITKEGEGSETTYFSDYSYLSPARVPILYGYCSSGSSAGAFSVEISRSGTISDTTIGGRLMFL